MEEFAIELSKDVLVLMIVFPSLYIFAQLYQWHREWKERRRVWSIMKDHCDSCAKQYSARRWFR